MWTYWWIFNGAFPLKKGEKMGIDEELNNIFSENTNEFDIDKEILLALENFYSKNNIEVKTEIPNKLLIKFVKLKLYAEMVKKYSTKGHSDLQKFIDIFMIYSLSSNRQSRKEFFEALKNLKSNNDFTEKFEEKKRLRDRFR